MITLNGLNLTLKTLQKIIIDRQKVRYTEDSMKKVIESRKAVEHIVSKGKIVYGVTTGFGKFSDVFIDKDDVENLQLNLIRSHACGVGDPWSTWLL
ncbi:aromatic amino acid lyase [Metabacillus schmidteae]|uniref:aromatic amino acid lyase n=1 Tax=Metabacillus schmidteae TaxID=2730405 RepID=UPI00158E6EE2|nr:aromatic amino acid lyase [Metabacillus schmidteae]